MDSRRTLGWILGQTCEWTLEDCGQGVKQNRHWYFKKSAFMLKIKVYYDSSIKGFKRLNILKKIKLLYLFHNFSKIVTKRCEHPLYLGLQWQQNLAPGLIDSPTINNIKLC